MSQTIRELRERRASMWDDCQKLLGKIQGGDGEANAEFDRIMADMDALKATIDRMERLEAEKSEIEELALARAEQLPVTDDRSPDRIRNQDQEDLRIFNKWCAFGFRGLDTDERQWLQDRRDTTGIYGAQSVGTDSEGGYLVPTEFRRMLEQAMLAFGGMRQVSTILRTAGGGQLEMPTVDDTSNTGALLAENAADAEQDVVFGQVLLDAYKYTSRIVRVSVELMQDSAFSMDTVLANLLGERLGRITNTHFTTGTGTAQPNGVVTASTQGKVGQTGQTTTIIYDDLVDLEHAVDPAYRVQNPRWMMNDASLAVIKKLADSQGLPLYVPAIAGGTPDTILGYPYTINQDVVTMSANAKSVLFGPFSKYMIRDVLGITLRRLVERYAEYHQVAFVAIMRADGDLLDAGTNPIQHYANSAT